MYLFPILGREKYLLYSVSWQPASWIALRLEARSTRFADLRVIEFRSSDLKNLYLSKTVSGSCQNQ
jgi:hypothetical protein